MSNTLSEELVIQDALNRLDNSLKEDQQELQVDRVVRRIAQYYKEVLGREVDEETIRQHVMQSMESLSDASEKPSDLVELSKAEVEIPTAGQPLPLPTSPKVTVEIVKNPKKRPFLLRRRTSIEITTDFMILIVMAFATYVAYPIHSAPTWYYIVVPLTVLVWFAVEMVHKECAWSSTFKK